MYRERTLVAVQCSSMLSVREILCLIDVLGFAVHEICTSPYRASAKHVTFGKLKIPQNGEHIFTCGVQRGCVIFADSKPVDGSPNSL